MTTILCLLACVAAAWAGYATGWNSGYERGTNDGKALDVQLNKLQAMLFKGRQPDGSVIVCDACAALATPLQREEPGR